MGEEVLSLDCEYPHLGHICDLPRFGEPFRLAERMPKRIRCMVCGSIWLKVVKYDELSRTMEWKEYFHSIPNRIRRRRVDSRHRSAALDAFIADTL